MLSLDWTDVKSPSLATHSQIIDELLSEVPEIVDAANHVKQFWHELKEAKELNPVKHNKYVIEEPWLDESTLPSCLEKIRRDDLEIEPLLVIGPRQLKRFLDAHQRLEDLDMQFLDCRSTTEAWNASDHECESNKGQSASGSALSSHINNKRLQDNNGSFFARGSQMQSFWQRPGSPVDNSAAYPILERLKKMLLDPGLEALISFPVVHCPQAFGIALKVAERVNDIGKVILGWKIACSGDTRPCPELIEACHGATVLIHEAT